MDAASKRPEVPQIHGSEPARLPPGQTRTEKFPVVGERAGTVDPKVWRLEVEGLVRRPLSLSLTDLQQMPMRQRVVDIHCVTGWSRLGMELSGWPLSNLLALAEPTQRAQFVRFEAYSERLHDTSLPLAAALADTWLVHRIDGLPLAPEHGFPLRTVTPSRYFYKSLKWLHRVELLAEDRLGFWERESSYHNVGDPWPGDQRFTSGSLRPAQLQRFRAAEQFAPYRRKVLLGADLRGWRPLDLDLHQLSLKHCDLRGAQLAGADLRQANLSLSDLRGADLRGADLREADLEGADFRGADLRRADLSQTLLSATRFIGADGAEGGEPAARVSGLRWSGARGLLEDQLRFLERHGH